MCIGKYLSHFNYRLKKRYGLKITKEFYLYLIDCIQYKDKKIVKYIKPDKYLNRIIYKVKIKDIWVYVVYDKSKSLIYTCLDENAVKKI